MPSGWVNDIDSPSHFGLFPDTPANEAEFAKSESLAHNIFGGFLPRGEGPYFTCESAENRTGSTAAEILAAMETSEVLAMSNASDVVIGGFTGKQVDVRRNPAWTGTCPSDPALPAGVDPMDERIRGIMVDVPERGVWLMFLYSNSSADHEAFLAEAMPIIESIERSE